MTQDASTSLRRTVVRRLSRNTRGILELSRSGKVEFIHRTVNRE